MGSGESRDTPWRPVSGASATADDVIAFARDHLAHFKAPSGVTFLAELPKTATGKVQKYVLRGGRPAIARQ
jgi:fatty-acyl-CoA synthase